MVTRYRVLLGELLPVFGTVGLLGLWLFQQTGIEHRAGELRQIATARAVFQTYQSTNAIFNAIGEAAQRPALQDSIRVSQIYNYELGLRAIEDVLPAARRGGIPPAGSAFDGIPTGVKMERTQKRLELLQGRLSEYEQSLRAAAEADAKLYLVLYLAISAASIAGAVLKAADKLVLKTGP
ncbi:MAG TPA: hypothetical protein VGH86_05335 [Phenylobacterium sp.]